MKFRTWLWKGFINLITSEGSIVLSPTFIGAIISGLVVIFIPNTKLGVDAWKFIPILVGGTITIFLMLYLSYKFDEKINKILNKEEIK